MEGTIYCAWKRDAWRRNIWELRRRMQGKGIRRQKAEGGNGGGEISPGHCPTLAGGVLRRKKRRAGERLPLRRLAPEKIGEEDLGGKHPYGIKSRKPWARGAGKNMLPHDELKLSFPLNEFEKKKKKKKKKKTS